MRDYRDAKIMAQTLRESLNAKSISLTHSESLELIAKILGFHDWNVLSAEIKLWFPVSAPSPATPAAGAASLSPHHSNDNSGESTRQEIAIDAVILDRYVGFYQLNDDAVFTVTRGENHLVTRLSGQRSVPIYGQSDTEFFARRVNAQINFITDARGQAVSLILHQGGREHPMNRIDAATAQKIEGKLAEKVKSQSAAPGSEAALCRLIDGLTVGEPNYEEMSAPLADLTRQQLPNLQRDHEELGPVRSIKFLGVGGQGEDVYTVNHENGASHWRIWLDSKAAISMAAITPGP